ncbi:hypothetical protein ELE36_01350 [Pseudolysobacter antarcticus]|uniref:HEAT repeat domain-containing protein n=1 Tax=Pseudolysobacter antarcticus TaxID=2511995 RepID=A0A411HF70_9GAMM|nr:hypothetical protein [Pseudolysobacter antarcticus]QBB69135.1 hypothetical protein ELE36_01350 [Pseudolysobacter antarcticus]
MSRWSLIALLFAATSGWSQQTPTTRIAAPAEVLAPVIAHGSSANNTQESANAAAASIDDDLSQYQSDESQHALLKQWVQSLARSNDARMLMAAALYAVLLREDKEAELSAAFNPEILVARAKKIEPRDPQILWVGAIQAYAPDPSTAYAQAIQSLTKIVPENGATWLLELDGANKTGDTIAAHVAIEHAAKAKYFDDYATAIIATLLQADAHVAHQVSQASQPSNQRAINAQKTRDMAMSFGVVALMDRGYRPLLDSCDPKLMRDSDAQLRLNCVAIGRLMSTHSTSAMASMMGLRLQQRLIDDATGIAEIERERHRLEWLFDASGKADEIVSRERLYQLLLAGDSEVSRMRTLISEAGMPLEPPAEWESPHFHSY